MSATAAAVAAAAEGRQDAVGGGDPKVRPSFWGARRGQERRQFLVPPRNQTQSKILPKCIEILASLYKKLDAPWKRRNASGLAVWRPRKTTKSEGGAFNKLNQDGEADTTIFHSLLSHRISFGFDFRRCLAILT